MKVEDVRSYAEEKGMSPKRIDLLISELHPDEEGKLNPFEAAEAIKCIDYHLATIDNVKWCLNEGRKMRNRARNENNTLETE